MKNLKIPSLIVIIILILTQFLVLTLHTSFADNIGTITGSSSNDNFGFSVANAGDINGDGVNDIINSAPGYDNNRGRVYIYFGGPWLVNDLSAANANVTINGSAQADRFGWQVSSAGDVNKDGFADLIIGAPGNNSDTGKAYIFYGHDSMPKDLKTSVANITLAGMEEGDEFGAAVASAGDVNNDTYSDVIVGAPGYNKITGAAHIFLGSVKPDAKVYASHSDICFTGSNLDDQFGFSVSCADDVNQDGYDDVIVGAPGADQAYIYYGGDSMNAWQQSTMDEFVSLEEKVHINITNMIDGEVQLKTFYNAKAMMTYFDDTPSAGTPHIPRNRTWNQVEWTLETNANSDGISENQWFVLESGTVRKNEKILAVSDKGNNIFVQVSNGLSWGTMLNLNLTMDDDRYRSFDISYESKSGDGILVYYDKNTPTSPPQYQIWNGTNWSSPKSTQPVGGVEVWWVELASNPFSDEIIMVSLNKGTDDIYAQVWNGTGWGNVTLIEMTASRDNMQCFDVVYEQQSGFGMIVWGNRSINNKYLSWKRWIGDWSEPTGSLIAADNQVNVVKLAADPNSNYIISGNLDNGKEIDVQVWNGSAWSAPKFKVTTAAERNVEHCFDVAWEAKSDKEGLIVYALSNHRPACRNITGTVLGNEYYVLDAAPPDNGRNPNWVELENDPNSDDIMLMYLIDDGGGNGGAEDDIGVELWNGSAWTAPQRVEENSTRDETRHFDLAFTDTSGYFISSQYSIDHVVPWGRIIWNTEVPSGTILQIQTRTSNDSVNWSSWSEPYNNYDWITSPAGKRVQYNAWFETTDVLLTPILYDIRIELNHPDVIFNGTAGEGFGWSVDCEGDINGDSSQDLLIGAPMNNTDQGNVYIFYPTPWNTPTYLSASTGSDIIITGESTGDRFGHAVSNAGRFNGDSYDDIIIGAPYANNNGSVYIFFGYSSMTGQVSASSADQIEIGEGANDGYGSSVADVGDIDSRWGHECVVGAPYFDSAQDSGKSYIIMADTIMDIEWFRSYQLPEIEATIFEVGEQVEFKTRVHHTFGSSSIISAALTIKASDNTIVLNNQLMTVDQTDASNPSLWKIFIYSFTNPTQADIYQAEVTVTEINDLKFYDNLLYTLTPGPPGKISLELDPDSVIADGNSYSNITITITDIYDNPITGLASSIQIKLDDGTGTFGAVADLGDGTYKISYRSSTVAEPDAVINISIENLFDVVTLDLQPGPLARINITPASTNIVAGTSDQFEAAGFDKYNNSVILIGTDWTSDVGIILNFNSSSAEFKAEEIVGNGYIHASVGSIIGSAEISIISGELESVIVLPTQVDVTVGESQEFTAIGYDNFGNSVSIIPDWSSNIGSMTGSTLSAQKTVGSGYVNATALNVTGSAVVNVEPGPLARISLTPESVEVHAGEVREFEAIGYDKYNNLVEIDPIWYSSMGEMVKNVFTAHTTTGTGQVSAVFLGIIGYANVTVIPSELDHILVIPQYIELIVGGQQEFSAIGYDKYDNSIEISPEWSTDVGVMNDNILMAQTLPGEGVVEAAMTLNTTQQKIVGTAQVIVFAQNVSGRPTILGKIPDQVRIEDSPPWMLYLTPYESDDLDSGKNLKWYVTGEDSSLYLLSGEFSDDDVLKFTPVQNAHGSNKIKLWLIDADGNLDSQSIWVNLTPVNDRPTIYGAPDLILHYDDPYTFNYYPYIFDLETSKSMLTITAYETGYTSYTEVTGTNITFNYPKEMVNQEVYVTIIVFDGELTGEDTVMIKITDDWVPKLVSKLPDVTLYEGTKSTNVFDLDDYFTDPDQDALFYSFGETHVNVTINEDHSVDIASFSEWSGVDIITFRAEDPVGALAEDIIKVIVIPINDPPTIDNIPDLIVHFDYDYYFDLTYYVNDKDNLTSELVIYTSDPDHIRFGENDHMVMIINYPESMNGTKVPVVITVSDGLLSSYKIINIEITNDYPPEIRTNLPDIEFYEDTVLNSVFDLDNFFYDLDGDALFYSYGHSKLIVEIHNENTVTFSVAENWYGTEMVTFRAEDPIGALVEDTIQVNVIPINDAPELKPIPEQKGNIDEIWVLDLSQYISDVDNDITQLEISVDQEFVVVSGLKLIFYSQIPLNQEVKIDVNDGDKNVSTSFTVTFEKGESVVTVSELIFWSILILILIIVICLIVVVAKYRGNFKIEDVLVIYFDGTLISHKSNKKQKRLDNDILSGMLIAVQDFIKDSFRKNSNDPFYKIESFNNDEWSLNQLKLKGHDIYIERSEYLSIAVIYSGRIGWNLKSKIKHIMAEIDRNYSKALKNWNGNMSKIENIGNLIDPLGKINLVCYNYSRTTLILVRILFPQHFQTSQRCDRTFRSRRNYLSHPTHHISGSINAFDIGPHLSIRFNVTMVVKFNPDLLGQCGPWILTH
jgi:hypothetical protein